MLNAFSMTKMQHEKTQVWHEAEQKKTTESLAEGLMDIAVAQHRANFDLWHKEDKARDPGASDAEIARVKHAIDALNQQRNDLTERIDVLLLASSDGQNAGAPLHSETPGMMIDRLSILALKIYHTREEIERKDPGGTTVYATGSASPCSTRSEAILPIASICFGRRSSPAAAASNSIAN